MGGWGESQTAMEVQEGVPDPASLGEGPQGRIWSDKLVEEGIRKLLDKGMAGAKTWQ